MTQTSSGTDGPARSRPRAARAPEPALVGRDGRKWYVRPRKGGRGYIVTADPEGACARLPKDIEILEQLDGAVVAARRPARRLLEIEGALIRQKLADLRTFAHASEVWGDAITVYANARDRALFTESLDAEFADGFAAALEEFFARRYGRELAEWFRARRTGRPDATVDGDAPRVKPGAARRGDRYFPLLRFRLARRRERLFRVERVCFAGDRRWQVLDTLPLREAADKYLPHLGRATFFDFFGTGEAPVP